MEAKEETAQKHQPFRCKEEEEPEKAAWREEPEQLLKLATEKLRRTAPGKDGFLEEPEGTGKGWGRQKLLSGPEGQVEGRREPHREPTQLTGRAILLQEAAVAGLLPLSRV